MSSDDWQAVKEIAGEAMQRDAAVRASYIDGACAGREPIRREVESLIASFEESGTFLDVPALAGPPEPGGLAPGTIVDQYRITRRIAEGGMGDVYHAVRTGDYEQQVAIKVLRSGIGSAVVTAAFRRERQFLAQFEHPGIARLLDGGSTPDGLPYFVMEYVDGKPLDVWCTERQLPLADRLRLFRQVCTAVDYAHRNLIVHRDIKPANILVTPDGTPKLVDFGIAKMLSLDAPTGADGLTQYRAMTPAYASPEQVKGLSASTGADIYSLGVVLYILLTGRSPYRCETDSPYELERAICEQEPEPPSTHAGAQARYLRGDLDNIALLALQKDPQRRYASVAAFSDDLRRYLEGLPVSARPATAAYRTAKFIGRHKLGTAAGVLAVVALVATTGVALWQAREARAQHLRAERHFQEVRQLATSFLFDFHSAIRTLPGSTPARSLVVKRGLDYLDRLATEAHNDSALQRELAGAYLQLAEIQGLPGAANLGDSRGALSSANKAAGLYETALGAAPRDAKLRRSLAMAHSVTGRVLTETRDVPGARDRMNKALVLRQAVYDADPSCVACRADLAASHYELGVVSSIAGDFPTAIDQLRHAVELYQSTVNAQPSINHRGSLALVYKTLASILADTHSGAAAAENIQAAVALDEAVSREQPQNTAARSGLGTSYSTACEILHRVNRDRDALDSCEKALQIREAIAEADPKNASIRVALAFTHMAAGWALIGLAKADAALAHAHQAIAIREDLARKDPENRRTKETLAESYKLEGQVYTLMAGSAANPNRRLEARQQATAAFQRAAAAGVVPVKP